ncbi:hypothetical protein [Tateyamaria sp. ANG-S1]|uniref:hypothetical protein n=1 Tax=Tateyamaria sp. ANG-S1 TaxID=1577905 RepID=UPI00057C4FA7|nr:hypothetical protein [Tateyamaria sp. ANG-S1]KIC48551.1 hypothetical protein RA29_12510 [Tateyamaria sp. ANG-S1]
MTRLYSAAKTLAAVTALALTTTAAHADLTAKDIAAFDGKSGVRVYSSDGDFVGTTNGLRVSGERVRLFLLPRSGSIFRLRGRDVIVTTKTDLITRRGNDLVLDADTLRLRIKAQNPASDQDGALTILLLT